MSRPFILGLSPSIPDSPLLETDELHDKVGHNTGNLAFHYAIDKHLGGGLDIIDWSAPAKEINDAGPVAVLPCANQLGAHSNFASFAAKLEEVTVPIVAIGLGAQSNLGGEVPAIPQGTVDWVRSIMKHAPRSGPNVSVRGDFTLKVLDHYGLGERAIGLGCPTLFINPHPRLGERIAGNLKRPQRIAVPSGHPRWRHLARLEASLAQLVTETSGSYIGQSPLEMMKLTRGEANNMNDSALEECRSYSCPDMDLNEFRRWSVIHGAIFWDIPGWIEHYKHFDFVIGTRIHGIMLALQAGVPAVCIAHDSRTLELCKTMMVPYIQAKDVLGGITRGDIPELFDFDPVAFDERRADLANRYCRFLESNCLPTVAWLRKLARMTQDQET